MNKRVMLLVLIASLILSLDLPVSNAVTTSDKPPILAYDYIRCRRANDILDVAIGLGFETREIIGNTIIESDLEDADILVLSAPFTPYFTQTEITIILDFLERGEALYIIPAFSWSGEEIQIDPYYNILYETFGFKVSGRTDVLSYPDIKNVTFTHPIMDGVSHIYAKIMYKPYLADLELLTEPAEAILVSEGTRLFLVSAYGKGRIFVDLTDGSIGLENYYDNRRVVRNALIWLKATSLESFQVEIEQYAFNITTLSNSIISSFELDEERKSITFGATGLLGTEGSCNITIPKGLMWSDTIEQWMVVVDGSPPTYYSVSENDSSTALYFEYNHSSHEVEITSQYVIPEFQLFLVLPLFMISTLLTGLVYRRRK